MVGMTLSVFTYMIMYHDPSNDNAGDSTNITTPLPLMISSIVRSTRCISGKCEDKATNPENLMLRDGEQIFDDQSEHMRWADLEEKHRRYANGWMNRLGHNIRQSKESLKRESANTVVLPRTGSCPMEYPVSSEDLQPDVYSGETNMRRGIFIDFIYNPNFYYELSVLKHMLLEIILKNPQTRFYYDYEAGPHSTVIAIGHEHQVSRFRDRSIIFIKPKLLKDILYIDDIFRQIYNFLLTFFRTCVSNDGEVPEYDRTINFKRYREIFKTTLDKIDASNKDKSVCRSEELYGKYNGRICIRPDYQAIQNQNFSPSTTLFWQTLLHRTSIVMTALLTHTFDMTNANNNCYRILLRPETNIRRVLLFGHAAVKTASQDDQFTFSVQMLNLITDNFILFKHRILHALGLGHRYQTVSVMNSYDKPWQMENLFTITEDDYERLSQCYSINGSRVPSVPYYTPPNPLPPQQYYRAPVQRAYPKKYVTRSSADRYDAQLFVENFDEFMRVYGS